ncbi:hypothetical protein TNCV_4563011 [Trichonephila clavipes]|uniref:Uncharacterized protein n=1 Tax=Trichonephila clavipes TaxID=2585209 RepID=A0A8X7BEX9_TRICX|nr:hypothetical protein TNCV_4563011 [Trichonephila clavipes]
MAGLSRVRVQYHQRPTVKSVNHRYISEVVEPVTIFDRQGLPIAKLFQWVSARSPVIHTAFNNSSPFPLGCIALLLQPTHSSDVWTINLCSRIGNSMVQDISSSASQDEQRQHVEGTWIDLIQGHIQSILLSMSSSVTVNITNHGSYVNY